MPVDPELNELSSRELLHRVRERAQELARRETELAKLELESFTREDLKAVVLFGACAVLTVTGVTALAAAAVLALALILPAWLAALIVAFSALLPAAALGAAAFRQRPPAPLGKTRRLLTTQLRWLKEQLS